jgi:hypothetical protein
MKLELQERTKGNARFKGGMRWWINEFENLILECEGAK